MLRAAGDALRALSASQHAITRFAGDSRMLYAAALCFEDLGQADRALAHYDSALKISPDFADALHNRGLLLARLGRFEDAEANERRYLAVHPKTARAYSGLADIQLALARYEEAIETLEALLRLAPQDVSSLLKNLPTLRRIEIGPQHIGQRCTMRRYVVGHREAI